MTPWGITWTPRALRDLRHLDRAIAERVRDALRRYAATSHGDWRVRFDVDRPGHRLIILRVLPRGRAYDR